MKMVMDMKKDKFLSFFFIFLLLGFSATTSSGASANKKQSSSSSSSLLGSSVTRIGSSAVFPVRGNVYPDGYYYVELKIGNPPKPYYLDIDTGSDLTWLQCDAPCTSCSKVPHPLYRPKKKHIVYCADILCASLQAINSQHHCDKPNDQCDYEIEYADQASSLGILVKDVFPIRFTNGSLFGPLLGFGCGYDQHDPSNSPTPTDGVLGLSNGKSSIVSQLHNLGLIKNVVGHCFSSRGGGYLFLGDDLVPSSAVTWTPMARNPMQKNYYSPGPAELLFGKQSTGVKGLQVVFDSGSSYTYFNAQAYSVLISMIMKDLSGKPLKEAADQTLPVCWKGSKQFKSISDVKNYFKPLILSFSKKAQLQISPESYLIISSYGNVCLGILNGTEIGLQNLNIIGDNFFQDQVVIYDNGKQQIGWVPADCSRLSNMDREDEESFIQPDSTSMGVLTEEQCPATDDCKEEI